MYENIFLEVCMIASLKRFFGKQTQGGDATDEGHTGHNTRVATCALLVEIARIDEKFTKAEMDKIL